MDKWTQRIRGAIGIGATWAAGWAGVGALVGLTVSISLDLPMVTVVRNYTLSFATLGLLGGAIFSLLMSFAERRRSFEQLSIPRFAAWGALGGFALGALAAGISLFGMDITGIGGVAAGAAALLGAGSAAGTLAIARGPRGKALPAADALPRELIGGK